MMDAPEPQTLAAKLEALLFIYGEPMPRNRIAKLLGIPQAALAEVVGALAARAGEAGSGLMLVDDGEQVQLATKPAFAAIVEQAVKSEMQEALTPAAQEALAIIAYAGPVTRSEVDYIRGVNSSFIVRALLIRGLIERSVHPSRQNIYQYRASTAFLKHLGCTRAGDLPEYVKFQDLVKKIRPAEEKAVISNQVI